MMVLAVRDACHGSIERNAGSCIWVDLLGNLDKSEMLSYLMDGT